jgi:hypothetical protein
LEKRSDTGIRLTSWIWIKNHEITTQRRRKFTANGISGVVKMSLTVELIELSSLRLESLWELPTNQAFSGWEPSGHNFSFI